MASSSALSLLIQRVGTMSNGRSSALKNAGEVYNEEVSDSLALLPRYLRVYVSHYHDDFYVAKSFDPRLIAQLMCEGFLPIAGSSRFLLPKLHLERCVLQLRPHSKLHISKSTRKKSKRFQLSINAAFDDVVKGCHKQHGINWLFPPIVNAFRALQRETIEYGGCAAQLVEKDSFRPSGTIPVRFYSVEIWNATTGELAGGELGYSVGGIYTSLTGFTNEDAAGSVQLAALGKLLLQCGFINWDLGMEMEYKRQLGAELIERTDFVREVHRTRVENKDLVLRCNGRKNAKEIIDFDRPDDDDANDTKPRHGTKHDRTTNDGGAKKRPHKDEKMK
jgi:Leu/Phe-tRNA-protein transferase